MAPKRITRSPMIGARGTALVAKRIFDMGFVWHPTDANVEAGIDGFMELRDVVTEALLGLIVPVQSRATTRPWPNENAEGFDYVCDQDELDYWLGGNAPIILVCSNPDKDEAYWVSIKDYFQKDVLRLQSRRIRFNKHENRFDESAREALLRLGLPRDSGIYLAPPPIAEELLLNLVPVSFSTTLWIGDTTARGAGEVWRAFPDYSQREWILHSKRLISFRDLTEGPWRKLCDQGTVESFPTSEWSDSTDLDREQVFLRLLNESMSAKLAQLGMRYFERRRDDVYHYFLPPANGGIREIHYRSLAKQTSREIVSVYTVGEFTYARHNAVSTQFRRLGGKWYVALLPTYHFTHDGERPIKKYHRLLAGIKRLEKHAAVMGQIVMWAELLHDPSEEDLFPVERYPFLSTGPLISVETPVGVDDESWVKSDEDPPEPLDALPLFKPEDAEQDDPSA